MPIPVICTCSAKLRVADHLRGRQIQCPECGTVHAVNAQGAVPVTKGQAAKSAGRSISKTAPPPPKLADILEDSGLTSKQQDNLEDKLQKGETLVWAGKPDLRAPFIMGWMGACGFFFTAAILAVMAIVMSVSGMGGWMAVAGFGAGAGLCVAGGFICPFLNRFRFSKAVYAVTNRRALAWDPTILGKIRFQEYDAADLARFFRAKAPFGKDQDLGHLLFAAEVRRKDGQVVRRHGFFYIPEAKKVEKLIREYLVDPYTDQLLG